MKLTHLFCILIISLITFSSCKTGKQVSSKPASAEAKTGNKQGLTDEAKLKFTRAFFDASKEKVLGNYELAADLFLDCMRIDPNNAAPVYELANIFHFQGNKEKALFYSGKAAGMDPQNTWYQLLYADCLQNSKKYGEAAKVYEILVKNNPERIDFYYSLANAYLYNNKPNEAVKVCDQIEKMIGVTEETSIQKIKIFKRQNNFDKTEKEIKKLIQAFPKESKYYGMLGELYQDAGMTVKALETYQELLKVDPENAFVHLSLADYYRTIKEYDKAYNEIKLAFQNKNLDIDTKVKILLSYYAVTEAHAELKGEAMELCKILVEVHPQEAKSHSVYGDFFYRDRKLEEAREQYRLAIALDKEKYVLWNQLLLINSELNDFASMQKESKEAMELFPNQPVAYLFNGVANIQQKNYEAAIEALNEGINFVFDNKPLLAQFYSNLGDTYYKNKNYKSSDEAYEKALENDPNNIYVLNNYSYYLSLRGENLERAEQMSKKSNELVPDNSSYQDTYAWILYRMKRYQDAKNWLEKAIKNGGSNNSVILEHYGDALYQLGDKENAIKYWNEAKQKGVGSEFLERKVSDKQLYE